MPKRFDQEWSSEDDRSPEQQEAEDRQMRNLRRWVDDAATQSTNAAPSQSDRPLNRWERRQRLKQVEQGRAKSSTEPHEATLQASSTHEVPVAVTKSSGIPPMQVAEVAVPLVAASASSELPRGSTSSDSISGERSATDPTQPPVPKQSAQKQSRSQKLPSYQEQLKQDFGELFGMLQLPERQEHYLRSRWLDQVIYMEGRAGRARDLHYRLRLTTIIGGVIIPALVSLNLTTNDNAQLKQTLAISTFVLSQVVAISAATEEFFNYGDRWRNYRRSVESLKTQGWQFFQLTNAYQSYPTHEKAFKAFSFQVEQILQKDVEIYATQTTEKPDAKKPRRASAGSDPAQKT
jgi:hypothetical protein